MTNEPTKKDTPWTPGPWRIQTNSNLSNLIAGPTEVRNFDGDDGYRTVATFQAAGTFAFHAEEEKNRMGNANLIAAAPELYDALKEIAEVTTPGDGVCNPNWIHERCRAALAKARGEQ